MQQLLTNPVACNSAETTDAPREYSYADDLMQGCLVESDAKQLVWDKKLLFYDSQVNNNMSVLPGITLGTLMIDTCDIDTHALQRVSCFWLMSTRTPLSRCRVLFFSQDSFSQGYNRAMEIKFI